MMRSLENTGPPTGPRARPDVGLEELRRITLVSDLDVGPVEGQTHTLGASTDLVDDRALEAEPVVAEPSPAEPRPRRR